MCAVTVEACRPVYDWAVESGAVLRYMNVTFLFSVYCEMSTAQLTGAESIDKFASSFRDVYLSREFEIRTWLAVVCWALGPCSVTSKADIAT